MKGVQTMASSVATMKTATSASLKGYAKTTTNVSLGNWSEKRNFDLDKQRQRPPGMSWVHFSTSEKWGEFKRVQSTGSPRIWKRLRASSEFADNTGARIAIAGIASRLLEDLSTLLVYQNVFRSPPGQAFLRILLGFKKQDSDSQLFKNYGDFFKLMAVTRLPSWKDYILESILLCEDNPFVEAAASVGNPRSIWWPAGARVPPALRAAAASDLDTLQRLSIPESTLSAWVAETVLFCKPEWLIAASSFGFDTFSEKHPSYVALEDILGAHFSEDFKDGLRPSELPFFDRNKTESQFGNPDSSQFGHDSVDSEIPVLDRRKEREHASIAENRARWRKRIGEHGRWSQAVPLLEKYHADHGVGMMASAQFLQGIEGKLRPNFKWLARSRKPCDLSLHRASKEILLQNFMEHAQRRSAKHVFLHGPSGMGKTWLLRSALTEISKNQDLRIVTLHVDELKYLPEILDQLGRRQWRLRFALVIDDLINERLLDETSAYELLKSALDGNRHEWPENVLLCATSSKHVFSSNGRDNEILNIAHLFDSRYVLECAQLNEENYLQCVKELVKHRMAAASFETSLSTEEVDWHAKLWADNLNLRNIRLAALFVNGLK